MKRAIRVGRWTMTATMALAIAAACSGGKSAADTAASASATHADTTPANTQSTGAGLPSGDGTASAKGSANASTPPNGKKTLLFVGTSLTAGLGLEPDSAYPMLIQQKIDSAGLPYEVTNAGVSGETTSGMLDRLDWLMRGNFSVLVLESGANDGLRGIPPSTVKQNIETAIERIKAKRPDAQVLLVQMEALPNLGPKYAAAFHAVYPAVAKETGVTLLPFLLTDVAGHKELNQSDGVHPNYVGERMVADHLWKSLGPILKADAAADATKA